MSSLVPFTFDTVELCVVTLNYKLRSRAKEVWKVLKYDKKTADVTEKTTLKNINGTGSSLRGTWWTGQRTREGMTIISMTKGYRSCYFLVNSLKQKSSEDTTTM